MWLVGQDLRVNSPLLLSLKPFQPFISFHFGWDLRASAFTLFCLHLMEANLDSRVITDFRERKKVLDCGKSCSGRRFQCTQGQQRAANKCVECRAEERTGGGQGETGETQTPTWFEVLCHVSLNVLFSFETCLAVVHVLSLLLVLHFVHLVLISDVLHLCQPAPWLSSARRHAVFCDASSCTFNGGCTHWLNWFCFALSCVMSKSKKLVQGGILMAYFSSFEGGRPLSLISTAEKSKTVATGKLPKMLQCSFNCGIYQDGNEKIVGSIVEEVRKIHFSLLHGLNQDISAANAFYSLYSQTTLALFSHCGKHFYTVPGLDAFLLLHKAFPPFTSSLQKENMNPLFCRIEHYACSVSD